MAINNAINNNYSEFTAHQTIDSGLHIADTYINALNGTFNIKPSGSKSTYISKASSGATLEYILNSTNGALCKIEVTSNAVGSKSVLGSCIGDRYFTLGQPRSLSNINCYLAYGSDLDTPVITCCSGIATMPLQPCFLAYNSALDVDQTGNGALVVVDVDTERFDKSSDFTADTFTASVDGKFFLQGTVTLSDITSANSLQIQIVTTNRTYYGAYCSPTAIKTGSVDANLVCLNISCMADMQATETAQIKITASGEASNCNDIDHLVNSVTSTYFSGYLAC